MKRITFWGAVIALAVWVVALAVMGVSLTGGIDTAVIRTCCYVMVACLVVVAICLFYRAWLKFQENRQEYTDLKETVTQLKKDRK